jgi:hypothetical protein
LIVTLFATHSFRVSEARFHATEGFGFPLLYGRKDEAALHLMRKAYKKDGWLEQHPKERDE